MVLNKPSLGPAAIVPVRSEMPVSNTQVNSPVDGQWWARYRANIGKRLSPTALSVLEVDTQYIVKKAIPFNAGEFEASAWPASRVRTGMVVGSVQSGKTASMLGVAAMALDAGIDLLVRAMQEFG